MEVCIRAVTQPGDDELRSLAVALRDGNTVDGPISLGEGPLAADRLGPVLDMITVSVSAGTAIAGLIREVARYLLRRTLDLEVELSIGPDGPRCRLIATELRRKSRSEVELFVHQTARELEGRTGKEDRGG